MKVRVIRDTYDYKAGTVVEMPQSQAEAWVHAELAEAYEEKPVKRAKPAPQNKAKAAPKNKAKRSK